MWVTMVYDIDKALYMVWITVEGNIVEYKEFNDIRTAQAYFEKQVVLTQQ